MQTKERRNASRIASALKRELNESQLATLYSLERYGWELKFIRRPLFRQSIAIAFDADRKTFAVLEPDGTLNENPGFDIRK